MNVHKNAPLGDRADTRAGEGGDAVAADRADHQPRSVVVRQQDRCDRQFRGRADRHSLWTKAKRCKIIESRVNMTGDVVSLIARLQHKPAVLVSGSAIGSYGLWQGQPSTESAKSHACFSPELCEAWEQAAQGAEARGVRVVFLRIGLVLGAEGGFITPDADAV